MKSSEAFPIRTVDELVENARARTPLGAEAARDAFVADGLGDHPSVYENRNERLNIDFSVVRLPFPDIQTMDPRIVRIAPGKNNELHRHAHESLFVVLEGSGEVRLGDEWSPIAVGKIAFVPRWIFHQTRNTSAEHDLVLLAITDFGFTSSVLGDYDKRTRVAASGDDSLEAAAPAARADDRAKPGPAPSGPSGWWQVLLDGLRR